MGLCLRTDDVIWRELDGEVVILDLRSSQYLHVNTSGAILLEALRTEVSTTELAELLIEHYELSRAQATADVDEFLDALGAADLLELEDRRNG